MDFRDFSQSDVNAQQHRRFPNRVKWLYGKWRFFSDLMYIGGGSGTRSLVGGGERRQKKSHNDMRHLNGLERPFTERFMRYHRYVFMESGVFLSSSHTTSANMLVLEAVLKCIKVLYEVRIASSRTVFAITARTSIADVGFQQYVCPQRATNRQKQVTPVSSPWKGEL